jgi:hypothetical protein
MISDAGVARRIAEAMPEGGLFHEKVWRVATAPFEMPGGLLEELPRLGYRLQKFLRACNLLYLLSVRGKMPSWIAEYLDAGKPREVIELARERAFRNQIPGVIRPDLIPTESGYILSEIDSVPGGIGLLAWLNERYAEEGFPVLGGARGMQNAFAALLRGAGDIIVSREAASYRPEMNWLAESLRVNGFDCSVRDEFFDGPWKPTVYRFFEMFDLPNIPCATALFEAARSGKVRIDAPPKAFLEEKMWFAFFWMKPLEDFWIRELGERAFIALRRCIPRTWILDPKPLPPHAVYPALEIQSWETLRKFSQKQRRLVIKISGFSEIAWGARGVTIGHDVSLQEWSAAIDTALASFPTNPYILQEFHAGRRFEVSYLEPATCRLACMDGRARLCPYFFTSEQSPVLGGVLATICPSDKKILHGMEDAVLAPVLAR